MADALHPQTLLTWGMNDGDLPVSFGGPLRMRVPRQLGYKSVKYITHLTVTDSVKDFGKGLGSPPGRWLRLVRRHLSCVRSRICELSPAGTSYEIGRDEILDNLQPAPVRQAQGRLRFGQLKNLIWTALKVQRPFGTHFRDGRVYADPEAPLPTYHSFVLKA